MSRPAPRRDVARRPQRRGRAAGARAVLGLLLASCASGAPKTAAPAPVAAAAAPRDPRAEIEALDRAITDELGRAHVAAPATAACTGAACATAMATPFAAPASGATCGPAPSDRCTDVCTLSTSICENQQKLCELAQRLPGDDWAANKCTRARASCTAAHDACCGCVL
jgi:hypothetical protein